MDREASFCLHDACFVCNHEEVKVVDGMLLVKSVVA